MTPDRARMQYLDGADLAANNPALQPAPDGLDLGKFRHLRSVLVGHVEA